MKESEKQKNRKHQSVNAENYFKCCCLTQCSNMFATRHLYFSGAFMLIKKVMNATFIVKMKRK